jgi:nucleoside-diphosphate-sugar epimerase
MQDRHTALITGATGFIGRRLAERLRDLGVAPRLFVRAPERLAQHLRETCDIVVGDLGDPASLAQAVQGVDLVFHCAANVSTWERWDAYDAANVQGVRHLLQAIETRSAMPRRLVHVSSVDVYGFPRHPCDEDCPTRATGFGYGDSKLQGENLVRDYGQRLGLPYTIIRPTNVMGPHSPFIRRIGDELRSGLMLTIDGGRADAGFLHVDNLVDCLIWASTAECAAGQIYNVSDPEPVTWRRFIDDFRRGIGGRGKVIDLPFALADAAAMAIETPYRLLGLRTEPLLHRLIVRIFGRTCGHSAGKIVEAGGETGRVPYPQAMAESVAWYLAEEARGQ